MHRKASVLTAMLATTIAVAACGGSSPSSGNSTSASARVSQQLKMARCIRAHGVPKFPDSGNGPNRIQSSQNANGGGAVSVDGVQLGVSPQTLQKAMSACQKYAPQGPPISGAQLAKLKQGALKMAECMRSHGVPNFPDPKITTGPGGKGVAVRIGGGPRSAGGGGGLNPGSPAFQAAQKTCMPLMGNFGKGQKVAR
ncbi:MAG TPA: hypothetical protein VG293_03170 [Solirubrobacteraceae bacterium]|jgi:hypothetical protein|nr:hypothetical protein [Solirubrobacteraceae bacterium]